MSSSEIKAATSGFSLPISSSQERATFRHPPHHLRAPEWKHGAECRPPLPRVCWTIWAGRLELASPICTMFNGSGPLRQEPMLAVLAAARHLCTSYVYPRCIGPLTACRRRPLSKDPVFRPIGSVRRCGESPGKPFCKLLGTTSVQCVTPLSSVHDSSQVVRQ